MTRNASSVVVITVLAAVLGSIALAAQDKYTVKVPNGLAFSEFRGYEDWPVIAISENQGLIAVIVGNPVMIDAYREGIPGNGKPLSRRRQDGKNPLEPEKTRDVPRSANGARHPA